MAQSARMRVWVNCYILYPLLKIITRTTTMFWWASCQLYVLHNFCSPAKLRKDTGVSTEDAVQDVQSDPL